MRNGKLFQTFSTQISQIICLSEQDAASFEKKFKWIVKQLPPTGMFCFIMIININNTKL